MVVVDSSGWIEYFTDGPKASAYARHLKELEKGGCHTRTENQLAQGEAPLRLLRHGSDSAH